MPDHPITIPGSPEVTPEVTLAESAAATLADLASLVTDGLARRPAASARIADKLSEELAELAQMLRCLPGRPLALAGYDFQLLAALRTSHASGEDVSEAIAHALARLAVELGGSLQVLASRPGSWEASHIAELLRGTVGPGDEDLGMFASGAPGGSL